MAAVTTAQLFSHQTFTQLVVDPLFATSRVLRYLRRIDTTATEVWLPTVSGGTAAWYNELEEIADAGVTAGEVRVVPKKVAALQIASNETAADANAAAILGQALTDTLSREVERAFFAGAGPKGPAGLPGIVGFTPVLAAPTALTAYVDAISAVTAAGGTPSVIFVNNADWAAVQKLPSATGSNVPALNPQAGASAAAANQLYGVPVQPVSQLPAGTAWVVDGSRTVVVMRIPGEVAVSDGPRFTSDGLVVRVKMRLEFASVYPSTVARIRTT